MDVLVVVVEAVERRLRNRVRVDLQEVEDQQYAVYLVVLSSDQLQDVLQD